MTDDVFLSLQEKKGFQFLLISDVNNADNYLDSGYSIRSQYHCLTQHFHEDCPIKGVFLMAKFIPALNDILGVLGYRLDCKLSRISSEYSHE